MSVEKQGRIITSNWSERGFGDLAGFHLRDRAVRTEQRKARRTTDQEATAIYNPTRNSRDDNEPAAVLHKCRIRKLRHFCASADSF